MEFSRRGFLLGSAAGAALGIGSEVSAGARTFDAPPSALDRWRQARFGMFLHWGLYSILGRGEWALFLEQMDCREYRRLMDRFNPTEFDADVWAATAKAAGMKYMVLTSRHCDGFCLWDSQVSDFTSTRSAAKRDFVAEYTRACRKAGLLVGLYYSPADWRFPGFFFPNMYRESAEAMRQQTYDQVRELLTHYGKIDILWFDAGGDDWLAHGGLEWKQGGWHSRDPEKHYSGKPLWEAEKLYAMIRELQPEVILSDRAASYGDWQGDFTTPEGRVGAFNTQRPWETCHMLCTSWGYKTNDRMKSLRTCVQLLVGCAVGDGNLLLNQGPRAEGSFEPRAVRRLKEVGRWLDQFGESIYGTRGGPFPSDDWGGCTHRGSRIYVHVLNWTEDVVVLPPLQRKIVSSRALTASRVEVDETSQGVRISVPPQDRQAIDTIVELELDGPAAG
jgi:alpha-L-fucosidase